MSFEIGVSAKWLELLKEIAPPRCKASGGPSKSCYGGGTRPIRLDPGGGSGAFIGRIEITQRFLCRSSHSFKCKASKMMQATRLGRVQQMGGNGDRSI